MQPDKLEPRWNGELSAPDDIYECVTCQTTGKVHAYGGVMASTGGVSVEIRVVGHRDPPTEDEWRDDAWEPLSDLANTALDRVRQTAWWKRAVDV